MYKINIEMSQLECKGVILIDSKLENILLAKDNKGILSFPKKANYFEEITQQFTKESGIDIDRINEGSDDGNNVRYFIGILNDKTTIQELCDFFSIVKSDLEWINSKTLDTKSFYFNEMKDLIESAFKIVGNIPKEERCQTRDWKENLLQFENL